MLKYGDKRDYPKIDVYVDGNYVWSTTWCKTCKEAIERAKVQVDRPEAKVTARFDKRK